MVNFVDQFDWKRNAQIAVNALFLVESVRVFPKETSN